MLSIRAFALVILSALLCSCGLYRVPSEGGDLHTVPTTNNPHIIKDKGGSSLPGVSY